MRSECVCHFVTCKGPSAGQVDRGKSCSESGRSLDFEPNWNSYSDCNGGAVHTCYNPDKNYICFETQSGYYSKPLEFPLFRLTVMMLQISTSKLMANPLMDLPPSGGPLRLPHKLGNQNVVYR
jgi:hypothetical protein